jgi:competence protein ComEC
MKRPLAPVALLFGLGIVAADWVEVPLAQVFGAASLLGLTGLCWERTRPILLAALVFLAGWANLGWRQARLSPHDLRDILGERVEQVSVRGTLCGPASQRVLERDAQEFWRTLAPVEVTALRINNGPWQPATGLVQTSTRGQELTNFFAGQAVEVTGVLGPPPGAVAQGLFDYRAYLRRLGVYYQLQAEGTGDWQAVGPVLPAPWTEGFRRWAQSVLGRGLPGIDEPLKLQWAMVLGWKTALTGEVSQPFMRSGTMHVFAISGLHIALIAGLLLALFRLVNLPRSLCGALVIPLIWFYTAATEWQASAIRSTVMMTVVIAGWSLRRPSNLLNSLAAAAFLILIWDPAQLFQAGFQLSFGAVMSLAVLVPPFDRCRDWLLRPSPEELAEPAGSRAERLLRSLREKLRRVLLVPDPLLPRALWPRWQRAVLRGENWLLQAGSVSLAATVGTAPLIAFYFHLFSPVSLLANLVVVPLSGFALTSGLGGVICGDWLPWMTECFNHAGWFFMACMAGASERMAGWPGAYWHVRSPGVAFLVLYYALLIAWLVGGFQGARRRPVVAALALLAVGWLVAVWHDRSVTRLTVLPLRGGEAIWFEAPGRARDWLIDAGDALAAERVTVPFLRAQGVNRLPQLVLTHGDVRHVGGVTNLLANFVLDQLYTGSVPFLSQPYRRALSAWTNRHGAPIALPAGTSSGPWTVLHPASGDRSPRADDKTLVLRGNIAGTRLLLCSDLGAAGQNALLQRQVDLRAEIVVAGLPAGGEPLHDALLEAIQPRLIIITDDDRPAAARSSPRLQARLEHRGVPVLFTRETRAVTLTFRRGRTTARTMNGLEFDLDDGGREAAFARSGRLETRAGAK